MIKLIKTVLLTVIFLPTISFAESSSPRNIGKLTISGDDGYINIYANEGETWNMPGCREAHIVRISSNSVPYSEELLSLILSAKMADKAIGFSGNCSSNTSYIDATDAYIN